ncbi:hypothetical protein SAMN06265365_104172 [Tistlia consotensis]|uniref:Ava_C0101 and related proteins n=1 Tax=Tistlia consotensis USBA 355 TaxID=560819 RepID=A0A1Y6BWC0_9PROT|nr:DUF5996 family protein [Tistlia consotensis]SMF21690.1 hypothetical protein SAMN05428998_107122 [Tistlia consotensis USBA 355]SNR46657.1 hypothetical protein SAMN06265365_104172 [Tistlia consotensis]
MSVPPTRRPDWPEIPFPAWRETCRHLHLMTQVVGKYRLARSPWLNHSWHATLYVTARGLATGPVPDGARTLEIEFDCLDHLLLLRADDGGTRRLPLGPGSLAAFHQAFRTALAELGADPRFDGRPNELPAPVRFAEDQEQRPYDRDAVERFWRALLAIDRVFRRFRSGFLGKVSPAHLFWGSFDLAVTRFSGRRAPLHPGGIPALPDAVTREAYSHEVASAGFWPGGGGLEEPAFYAYAYPAPAGFAEAAVAPAEACFHKDLGEFLLPYEAVRRAADPEAALLAFLQSTYAAAADLGGWDRAALDCDLGEPRRPRPVE